MLKHAETYHEAVPRIALDGFLQRVVNGGGQIVRDFATDRGAMDLPVTFDADWFGLDLKRVRDHDGLEAIMVAGVVQLSGDLDSLGLSEGWLVVLRRSRGSHLGRAPVAPRPRRRRPPHHRAWRLT